MNAIKGSLFLQIEVNTISSSFGPLGTIVSNMHHHIVERSASELVS